MSNRNLIHTGLSILILWSLCGTSVAQEANFIWSPQIDPTPGSQSQVFFRKRFSLVNPEKAELHVAAGDNYDLYINGQQVIEGQSFGTRATVDASDFLTSGINTIAARVEHVESDAVGLAIRLRVKEKGEIRYRSLVTDASWKSYIREVPAWHEPRFNDLAWLSASIVGQANVLTLTKSAESTAATATPTAQPTRQPQTTEPPQVSAQTQASVQFPQPKLVRPHAPIEVAPEKFRTPTPTPPTPAPAPTPQVDAVQVAVPQPPMPDPAQIETPRPPVADNSPSTASARTETTPSSARFEIEPGFIVEQLLSDRETGSAIAMEFDEFGRLLISREGQGLFIADLTLPLDADRVDPYCTQVTNIQGILPLNGRVYVTGEGPDGQGLYCLEPQGRQLLGVTQTLLRFTGKPSEHGAHGIQLGPDGFIYVTLGNGTKLRERAASSSPYQHPYEGDLVQRYEDPNGQSAGVKAPGGTIVRTSLDGQTVEIVAGGLRNAYDFAFNREGHLFFHDSDMETDVGASWYRPNQIYNVAAGGDYGWRSGWAKFAEHFIDQVPAITDTGRGSPTGAVVYQHVHLPARYHNSLFFADWTLGKIFAVEVHPKGAGFVGKATTFLTGKPLNVCDLAVSPSGTLCFCTGGRGSEGGVYQVRWQGETPAELTQYDNAVEKIIRHPQPRSAWGRQQLSQLRRTVGDRWEQILVGIAKEPRNENDYRIRALDLMVLYGPNPSAELLDEMANDESPNVRAAVARVSGIIENTEPSINRLILDSDPMVRRCAAESALRKEMQVPLESLLPMLRSFDRIEATVARRMLERMPLSKWLEPILETEESRVFIQGALAVCIAQPSLENSYKVLARASKFMEGFVNDADFIDMVRVSQLAMTQAAVDPEKIPAFSQRIANEFPAGNSIINRELIRLLAYLKNDRLDRRLETYLSSDDTPAVDKFHAAMMMQTLGGKLAPENRLTIIATLEGLKRDQIMPESQAWIRRAIREVASTITPEQIPIVLENGDKWTDAALAALFILPQQLSSQTFEQLLAIDQSISGQTGEDIEQLRTGILAVIAEQGGESGMDYLRKLWREEPGRRSDISLGLAQHPSNENWAYLVSSITELDDSTGPDILGTLARVQRKPREAQHYRDVIELGYRLRENGLQSTNALLQHWSGTILPIDPKDWQANIEAWSYWYRETFPNAQPVSFASREPSQLSTKVEDIVSRIENGPLGNPSNGRIVFESANCSKCHRCNGIGQSGGPDLSQLTNRYSLREMIEATVDPNLFVADRYRASKVLLEDGRLITGMTSEENGSIVVLTQSGKKLKYTADQVEQIQPTTTSPMPAGSLDGLSTQQIADLFSFLGGK